MSGLKGSSGRRTFTRPLAAELAVVELMGDALRPDVAVDIRRASGLRVGEYHLLRDELGFDLLLDITATDYLGWGTPWEEYDVRDLPSYMLQGVPQQMTKTSGPTNRQER